MCDWDKCIIVKLLSFNTSFDVFYYAIMVECTFRSKKFGKKLENEKKKRIDVNTQALGFFRRWLVASDSWMQHFESLSELQSS